MQQSNAAGKPAPVFAFFPLAKAMGPDESCKSTDVFRQEHRVVKQFLVTLVAERGSLAFGIPRTLREDGIAYDAPPIGGAAEESFRNIMMPRGM